MTRFEGGHVGAADQRLYRLCSGSRGRELTLPPFAGPLTEPSSGRSCWQATRIANDHATLCSRWRVARR